MATLPAVRRLAPPPPLPHFYRARRVTAHLPGGGVSSEPAGLSLRLEQGDDVALAHRALHVADDGAVRLVHELDAHLGALALRAGAAQHLRHLAAERGAHVRHRVPGTAWSGELVMRNAATG